MDLKVLNKNKEVIGLLDTIESIIWTERFNSYGDFELYTPVSAELLELLQEEYYLQIVDSSYTMVIESFEIKTDVETGNKLVVRGRDLSSLLDRRVIFQRQVYDNVAIHDIVWDILLKNGINSPGQTQRNIPGLTFSPSNDPAVTGPTATAEYYTEGVYDTIEYLCKSINIGFKLQFDTSNNFKFQLYAGKDRSYVQSTNSYVVFSPVFDNLINSDYNYTNRFKKTIALISGDAYNVPNPNRPTVDFDPWENDTTDPHYPTIRTGLDRREMHVDAPDLSIIDPATGVAYTGNKYTLMLYERARQGLNENVAFETFSGEADTTRGFKYQTDFSLGDIVQLENEYGLKGRARISEMIFTENLSGIKNYPTFEMI